MTILWPDNIHSLSGPCTSNEEVLCTREWKEKGRKSSRPLWRIYPIQTVSTYVELTESQVLRLIPFQAQIRRQFRFAWQQNGYLRPLSPTWWIRRIRTEILYLMSLSAGRMSGTTLSTKRSRKTLNYLRPRVRSDYGRQNRFWTRDKKQANSSFGKTPKSWKSIKRRGMKLFGIP